MHNVMGSEEGLMLAFTRNLCHGIPSPLLGSEMSLQMLEAIFFLKKEDNKSSLIAKSYYC